MMPAYIQQDYPQTEQKTIRKLILRTTFSRKNLSSSGKMKEKLVIEVTVL